MWRYIFRKYGMSFESELWRMGRICSTVANFSGRIDLKKPTKPEDFYKSIR